MPVAALVHSRRTHPPAGSATCGRFECRWAALVHSRRTHPPAGFGTCGRFECRWPPLFTRAEPILPQDLQPAGGLKAGGRSCSLARNLTSRRLRNLREVGGRSSGFVARTACSAVTPTSSLPTPTAVASPMIIALPSSPTSPPASTATLAATASLLRPTASPVSAQTPARSATLRIPSGIAVLAQGLSGPDDLALQPDGSPFYSDVGNGTVNRISPTGQVTTLLRGLAEPEWIVALPDSTMLIVEQRRNRIIRLQIR